MTTRDILTGAVEWRGFGVINPFADDGGLVDLADYPAPQALSRSAQGRDRRPALCAETPANWYRTIDRITPSLATKPKLLIPDIKGEAHIVFEGAALPAPQPLLHHLETLGSAAHCRRSCSRASPACSCRPIRPMRGGYLRFQAQYLRRIRIPHWDDVPAASPEAS